MTTKLYSLKDIASILGVTSQGVSNIKRRHAEFWPEPFCTDQSGSHELYSKGAVADIIKLRFPVGIATAVINATVNPYYKGDK